MSDSLFCLLLISVYRHWEPPLPENISEPVLIRLRGMKEPAMLSQISKDDIKRALQISENGKVWRTLHDVIVPERVLFPTWFCKPSIQGMHSAQRETAVLKGSISSADLTDPDRLSLIFDILLDQIKTELSNG